MTLYSCEAHGVFGSGRLWSFGLDFSSSATLATIEADWLSASGSFWTDGTHGVQTLYPTTTIFESTKTYQRLIIAGTPGKIISTAVATDGFTHAGTSVADGLPDQNAVLVSQRAAGVGPNQRGRTYLPAIDETIVVGDILGSTQATRVKTAMDALRAAMAAAGHTQVLWNDKTTLRDPAIGTLKTVVSCKVDRVIRTQRRRVRKEVAQYV
jgi:hypothetical protein